MRPLLLFLFIGFILNIFSDESISALRLSDAFVRDTTSNKNKFHIMPDTPCQCPPHALWSRARYTSSKGIGQKKGYSTLELFYGSMQTPNGLVFTDLRGHIFDNGRWAFNAGIGLRCRLDQRRVVAGLNLYIDYRRKAKNNFTQVGVGYELLGRYLGFRMN